MVRRRRILAMPQAALAAAQGLPDLTGHWVGFAALAVFAAAYALVISEEATHLRKSKPMVVAAGLLWIMIGVVYSGRGLSREAVELPCAMSFSNMPSCCSS